jgi:putative transposase
MSRKARLNIPGATYHVMNRGNRKALIFEDDRDRRQFLRGLVREQEIYGVKTLAGCLIGNHFHLAVTTPHGNLSDFMEQLEGHFASYSNWRHHRTGHLFGGPFRDVLIENDIHLLTALCYIFMNPVAARLARAHQDYKWSTYAATAGFTTVPPFLSLDWLASLFPDMSLSDSQRRFRALMESSNAVETYVQDSDSELAVSPEAIKRVISSYTGEQLYRGTLPRAYRSALRLSLDELKQVNVSVCDFISEARIVHGYRNADIAKALGLHPGTVSRMFCARRPSREQIEVGARPHL